MRFEFNAIDRVLFFLGLLFFVVGVVPVGLAQGGDSDAEPVAPWELASPRPGDWFMAPLLRLRSADVDYRGGPMWYQYMQMRAQLEATAGNHAAALYFWDLRPATRDSVGVLPGGIRAVDAIKYLAAVADTARVIMINERHHAASDRLLTLDLLGVLWKKGYRYFAAETFSYSDTTLNERTYPVEATGVYTVETVFAEVVREALRLGYRLVPYEETAEQRNAGSDLTPQQRRDRSQALNLRDGIFRDNPDAKVLVHAGFSHVLEKASERFYPMALYFREVTGINPVTVDQTKLSERSTPGHEHPDYRAALAEGLVVNGPVVLVDTSGCLYSPAEFSVDVQVLTPRTKFTSGRPDWMTLGGRRVAVEIEVPESRDQWCYVEAGLAGEPAEALPVDRAEADGTGTVRLFLPPGAHVEMRVVAKNGQRLRATEFVVPPKHD